MTNIIKLGGIEKIKYIDEILYVYNIENPISEWKIDSTEQARENLYIRETLL